MSEIHKPIDDFGLERVPGALFKAMGTLFLNKRPDLDQRDLEKLLLKRIAAQGRAYHRRTIRRQLSGAIASVPRLVEEQMRAILREHGGITDQGDLRNALREVGITVPADERFGPYVAFERIRPLVGLWLHFYPNKTKRFLATVLSSDLAAMGVTLGVNPLQLILAGKCRVVRREVLSILLRYLQPHGIETPEAAAMMAEKLADEIEASITGRRLISAVHFHELATVWQRQNQGASIRKLAMHLQEALEQRHIRTKFSYLQKLLTSDTGHGQRRVYDTLKHLVQGCLPPNQNIDDLLGKRRRANAFVTDVEWVKTTPVVDLAEKWLSSHPDVSKRQLAMRVAKTVKKLGYLTSHNTIQSVLAGRTTRTRGFVYRAMLKQFNGKPNTSIPAEFFLRDSLRKTQYAIKWRETQRTRGQEPRGPSERADMDAMDIYLRQISHIPLLSREEEVALTAAIGAAHQEIMAELTGTPYLPALSGSGNFEAEEVQEAVFRLKSDFLKISSDEPTFLPHDRLKTAHKTIVRAENASRRARNQLIESNLKLVVWIARKYKNRGLAISDLIQEGNIGLMKAVDRFEPTRGYRFSTYASWWIRQAIVRAITDKARTVRLPAHAVDTINALVRTRSALAQELGRSPTSLEIAAKLDISPRDVDALLSSAQTTLSLEAPVSGEDDLVIGDFVESTAPYSPSEQVISKELTTVVRDMLTTLSLREQRIIRLRFGIDEEETHTLNAVGQDFGVSRERVRQIQTQALHKLKKQSLLRRLDSFQAD
ncbi:MAG: RNA polymerase sigma factor RpoD/SigA [Myxococcota bacterium]|nr:RNA polymerase sigma factor RpoD/SigA [Myxococcota bacterium]